MQKGMKGGVVSTMADTYNARNRQHGVINFIFVQIFHTNRQHIKYLAPPVYLSCAKTVGTKIE